MLGKRIIGIVIARGTACICRGCSTNPDEEVMEDEEEIDEQGESQSDGKISVMRRGVKVSVGVSTNVTKTIKATPLPSPRVLF